ncbi:hypothetical protein JNJ66_03865 [Candidatus Saccharibacteria bacterium]|nr:hypothetical protein [Candidatus Saccharibacteria bacterium]
MLSRHLPHIRSRRLTSRYGSIAAGFVIFAAFGYGLYTQVSRAATMTVNVEAESGQTSPGADIIDDLQASNSQLVRFGLGGVAPAGRSGVPISPAGHLGQYNLSSNDYIMAFRFVLNSPATIDRWYFAINGEGADCVGGRTGYGSGNGGMYDGRIVEVDEATGLPTTTVVAREEVNGCAAYERSKTEFGLNDEHQSQFVQFNPVALEAGKLYAFLLSNTDPNPGNGGSSGGGNAMSPNLNFAKVEEMGPHGRNTLDAKAGGALYGLDPREAVLWSKDGGASWLFGQEVGWYDDDNGLGKMWQVGYRVAGGANIAHGWPFMNWPGEGNVSVTHRNAPRAVTLTKAGGASEGQAVGVITVTNTSTGVSATTASLGAGVVSGTLSQPVPVAAGESYSIAYSGQAGLGSGSSGTDKVFRLGEQAPWDYESSQDNRYPMVYAAP